MFGCTLTVAAVCFAVAKPVADAPEASVSVAVASDAALRKRIQSMTESIRDVPLPVIVEAITGHRVLPWSGEERKRLESVAEDVLDRLAAPGIQAARVNEAGNAVENVVMEALRRAGFEADRPAGPSGRAHAAGYPDLEARRGDHSFYIEVKTFSARTANSTQRSFYLSPSTDFKVTRDAPHLLIGIELARTEPGRYVARSVKWLDLSGLRCDLKYEFNANNRDLYGPSGGLIILERRPETAGGH